MELEWNNEERLRRAVDYIQDLGDKDVKISEVALKFDVHRSSLSSRIHRQSNRSRKDNGGQNKALSPPQEKALCETLDRLYRHGIPAKPRMVRSIAQQILDETYVNSAPQLSDAWGSRWLNRYPKYNVKTGRPFDIERRAA